MFIKNRELGREIDLLANYPKTKRDIEKRLESKSEKDRETARQFGKEFFDGTRATGYGGFSYHPRFWQPVIPDFIKTYSLDASMHILDVGCAKGFMLHDFREALAGISLKGIDISSYAIEQAMACMKPYLEVGDARCLPFKDDSFDLVISINTIHNLKRNDLICALQEIERVSRKHSFITVDAYRNEEEKRLMEAWNLTAETILHVDEWRALFLEAGYTGDYYWFIP